MAIKPIKGFYVYDEETGTEGVAQYSYDSLDAAPEASEFVTKPKFRNGTPTNVNNANYITTENIFPTHGAEEIKFKYGDIPLQSGYIYDVIIAWYSVESGLSSGAGFSTQWDYYYRGTESELTVPVNNEAKGFAFSITRVDEGITVNDPLRVANVGEYVADIFYYYDIADTHSTTINGLEWGVLYPVDFSGVRQITICTPEAVSYNIIIDIYDESKTARDFFTLPAGNTKRVTGKIGVTNLKYKYISLRQPYTVPVQITISGEPKNGIPNYSMENVVKDLNDVTSRNSIDWARQIARNGYFEINKPEQMSFGTYDSNGYTLGGNATVGATARCHPKDIYIPAHSGDRVKATSSAHDVLIAVITNPEEPNGTGLLYTSGWGRSFDIENQYEGFYAFLAKSTPDNFSGTFRVIPAISENLTIENYYAEEMADTLQKVRALETEPCLVFPLVTDIHKFVADVQNFGDTIANMQNFAKSVRCDFLVNLGDNTEGDTAPETTLTRSYAMMEDFRSVGLPYYQTIGNHDDNRYNADKFDLDDLYKAYISNVSKVNYGTMNGTNYYFDIENFKIRCIFLNANTNNAYGFSSDTVSWFTGDALDTPDAYSIIVFSHVSPIPSQNYNGLSIANNTAISTAIENYETTDKHVIALFTGHNHVDAAWTTPYNSVTTNCQKFENENGDPDLWPSGAVKPQRTEGTYTADCWDVVVVRPGSRKVNTVRFGAGSDREFTYGT